mmetsp:Transcript_19851/g.25667  ORF Transcript_19851/g.25667 Transcript_19851/m.25667 type:complete len:201 (+) Transcript_19851:294-896(+)
MFAIPSEAKSSCCCSVSEGASGSVNSTGNIEGAASIFPDDVFEASRASCCCSVSDGASGSANSIGGTGTGGAASILPGDVFEASRAICEVSSSAGLPPRSNMQCAMLNIRRPATLMRSPSLVKDPSSSYAAKNLGPRKMSSSCAPIKAMSSSDRCKDMIFSNKSLYWWLHTMTASVKRFKLSVGSGPCQYCWAKRKARFP